MFVEVHTDLLVLINTIAPVNSVPMPTTVYFHEEATSSEKTCAQQTPEY